MLLSNNNLKKANMAIIARIFPNFSNARMNKIKTRIKRIVIFPIEKKEDIISPSNAANSSTEKLNSLKKFGKKKKGKKKNIVNALASNIINKNIEEEN